MSAIAPGSKAEAVYKLILSQSPTHANRFRKHFEKTMFENTTNNDLELLNRFWRLQLASVPFNTIAERECLCDTPDFASWMYHFEKMVLPAIIIYNLPMSEQ